MTELELIRKIIPQQYKKTRMSVASHNLSPSITNKKRKQENFDELFRLIKVEVELSTQKRKVK
tara:strand:- start:26 stop:214 length:189 start_codon:yes stop_codon:yes gene_type:complete